MADHGLIQADQDALISAAYRVFDPSLAAQGFLRNILTRDQLEGILKVNRFTDTEASLYIDTLIRTEALNVALSNIRSENAISSGFISDPLYANVPTDFIQRAQALGESADSATSVWRDSFQTPPLDTVLSLVFRGVRTERDWQSACDYYRVPQGWRDDLKRANQALIPFRTIPSMLASGIIDEPYARSVLQAHGFSLPDVEALLKYAQIGKASKKAVTAVTLQTLSIATAKLFWIDGAISDQQYEDVLKEHGYDDQTAALTVKVESLAEHAKERKALGQQIVDEALAGVISTDQAQQQLTQNGFTLPEIAKYLKQLRALQNKSAKTPAEGELHAMFAKNVITAADYKSGLQQLGYSVFWQNAFAQLRGAV